MISPKQDPDRIVKNRYQIISGTNAMYEHVCKRKTREDTRTHTYECTHTHIHFPLKIIRCTLKNNNTMNGKIYLTLYKILP